MWHAANHSEILELLEEGLVIVIDRDKVPQALSCHLWRMHGQQIPARCLAMVEEWQTSWNCQERGPELVLYTEKAMCSNFAEELPCAATWTRWAIREKGQCFDMFESCLEHIWTPKMMPKHHQSWSDMKGNPKAVPVCILSVELRKLEVCDFGRFRFRIHLNPPEVLWCWRGPLGKEPGRNQRCWKPWCRASCSGWTLVAGAKSETSENSTVPIVTFGKPFRTYPESLKCRKKVSSVSLTQIDREKDIDSWPKPCATRTS